MSLMKSYPVGLSSCLHPFFSLLLSFQRALLPFRLPPFIILHKKLIFITLHYVDDRGCKNIFFIISHHTFTVALRMRFCTTVLTWADKTAPHDYHDYDVDVKLSRAESVSTVYEVIILKPLFFYYCSFQATTSSLTSAAVLF